VLGGLVALGFLLRMLWVGDAPLHPDEYHYAYNMMAAEETASLSAIRDLDTRFLAERRSAHPLAWSLITRWLWFLPFGWAFDWSPGFLRFPNVVAGTLLVPLAWGILRVSANRPQALAAALFVTLSPGLVWISRTLYQDTAFTLWVGMMLLGGAWALKRSKFWPAFVIGGAMGLALATKSSAPILLPVFALLCVVGPQTLELGCRLRRAAWGIATALALFLLFCSPHALMEAILKPTDPRYAGALSFTHLERTLVADSDMLWNIVVLDLPVTLLLAVLGAALAWRRERPAFPLLLLVMLACLSPLVLLHVPPLSGPHGFAPLYFVLALMAAPIVAMRPRVAVAAFLVVNALVSVGLIRAREVGMLDKVARAGVYPPRDMLHTLLHGDLYQRDPPQQILLVMDRNMFFRAHPVVRLAELTTGAVILAPAESDAPLRAEAWTLADVVVVQEEAEQGSAPGDFERVAREGSLTVWRRVAGEARRRFTRGEMEAVREDRYLFPGGVRVIAGRLAVDDVIVPRTPQEELPVAMDGRVNFIEWGTGHVIFHEEEATVELRSPLMEDVFWDY
jgi:hypothetical protein